MKEKILQGIALEKTFRQGDSDGKILQKLDVTIYDGDFTVVMGPSGAGKSTLLYALSGMDSITGGEVRYKGTVISSFHETEMARLRGREFGFVFQQTHLVSNLTLFENVAVAGYVSGKETPQQVQSRATELLAQMGVLDAANRLPAQVSGGEAQRAALARAMVGQPGLLFADEPTGALNKGNSEEVLNLLTELNRSGQSILMVTHDLRAALRANRILYLEDGMILDELTLPPFGTDTPQLREQAVSGWLTKLRW